MADKPDSQDICFVPNGNYASVIEKLRPGAAEPGHNRSAIIEFLKRKWAKELDYRLIKELWAFHDNRIAVRFQYEWHDDSGNWFRAHGNENWEFDERGLMRRREASINDVPIRAADRKFLWPQGPRPEDFPGLTELGL